jgi:uncharacterized protein YicC (UPF0701 family)
MTGFAAVRRDEPDQTVHVTVKSVNHRFLDLAVKAPSLFAAIEGRSGWRAGASRSPWSSRRRGRPSAW